MPLTRPLLLLTLLLWAPSSLGAENPSDFRDWGESAERTLTEESERLRSRLDDCLEALHLRMTELAEKVADAPAATFDDPRAAFSFLERELGADPALLGLPLGVQLIRDGEALAWTGFSLPPGEGPAPTSGAGTRFSLRGFGIYSTLVARGRLAGSPGLEWTWNLPLALRLPGATGGLPVLLESRELELALLPRLPGGGDTSGEVPDAWLARWSEGESLGGSFQAGLARSWRLDLGGAPLLELLLRGPSEPDFRRSQAANRRRLLGGGALLLVMVAGLLIRARLRRGRPRGLPLLARAPFIVIWVLLMRWILQLSGLPGEALPGPFWSARSFALALPGGGLNSPGEFLISALAALLILVLLLRPYLNPETEEADGEQPTLPEGTVRLPQLMTALFAPLLAVVATSGFSVLVFANCSPDLLFGSGLLSGDAMGFNIAIFLAGVVLLSLFLVPAHFAWRRLPKRRGLLLATSLPLLLLALLLAGPPSALALLLLLPVAWGFRQAATRLTGLLFHMVFVILALTLIIGGARDRARETATARREIVSLEAAERETSLWQPLLLERVLLDLGRDPVLRRQFQTAGGIDPWLALAAWQHSGLEALGERGSLEIYDARGHLKSRYQQGLELPEPAGHAPVRPGRPDLTLLVGQAQVSSGADSLTLLKGELILMDADRQPHGVLVLQLLDEREYRPGLSTPLGASADGFLARLLEGSQRLFLHLAVLGLLLIVDLIFSRFRLVRRYLPPLFGPRGPGFQHKLLGAFLLTALLPVVLTGLLAGRQIREQEDLASRRASLERALSARRSLENRVRQDARDLAASEYVRNFVVPDFPQTVRDIGSLERNRIMIFDGGGELLLDESLRNWSPAQVDSFLAVLPPGRVIYEREGRRVYAGLLLPMEVWHRDARLQFSVYYRLLLDAELLGGLGEVVGGELNLYAGGSLLHADRPEIFGLGYQAPVLDPATVATVALGGEPHHQSVERVGDLRFGRSTVPLPGARGGPAALLSSLDAAGLAGPRSAFEGGSLVLSMIALLMLLALGLGSFLAGRVFLPIRRLQMGTRRLSAGELSHRLPDEGRDEIGELVRGFNNMAEGVQAARLALEERRRFLESVLANVASGVLAFDPEGRLRSLNPAARRLLDLGETELEGISLTALAIMETAPAAEFFAHLAAHPDGLRGPACELRLEAEGGARSFRMADADTDDGRVLVFEDVTDLIRSQKLAAWSEMARQVAHEIKNPLTPIKLSAQYMGRAWRDGKENFGEILEDGLGSIGEQVEILRSIAQEFSRFGRRQELKIEALDLGALLLEILAPYRGETLDVNWSGPESIRVRADRDALRKVLLNLVENARQAMGENERRLAVALTTAGGRARLTLRDHGPGIPEDALARLFEPYFSTKTSGTGLGLAISAQLVEEMGGELDVKNHPEGGAAASLTLELSDTDGSENAM
jgi:signal transduction histidine kinase